MARCKWLGLWVLSLALSISSWSQTGMTSLRGTLTDPSGALLAGAEVMLEEPATGFHVTRNTDQSGAYEFPQVPPGKYTITAIKVAAEDPAVAEIIRQAEVIFISGGDQANYIRGWEGTPVQKAMNDDIAAGKPIGGTSAGLAVEGEFVYGALGDKPDDQNLTSVDVLMNPYFERVTLVKDFLKIPYLENLITDSHFAKRDRLGRSLGFLARIMKDGWSSSPREVAIDEKSAVLVEADGKAKVVGNGKGAYFLKPANLPDVCEKGAPLTLLGIDVYRVASGGHFDMSAWKGDGGTVYSLSVRAGKIESTQGAAAIY